MKSLLVSIIVALVIIITIIAAGEYHGIEVNVSKAIVSTYWLTIPIVVVGIICAIFGKERD